MTDNQLLTLASATLYSKGHVSLEDAARDAAKLGEIFGIYSSPKTQMSLFGAPLPPPWEDEAGAALASRAPVVVEMRNDAARSIR